MTTPHTEHLLVRYDIGPLPAGVALAASTEVRRVKTRTVIITIEITRKGVGIGKKKRDEIIKKTKTRTRRTETVVRRTRRKRGETGASEVPAAIPPTAEN